MSSKVDCDVLSVAMSESLRIVDLKKSMCYCSFIFSECDAIGGKNIDRKWQKLKWQQAFQVCQGVTD